MSVNENLNPLIAAQKQIKEACELLGTDPAVFEILKNPERVIEINIPVKMDDGSVKSFTAFRSLHSSALGPGKGGLRFHPDVNVDEVKALSTWMSMKSGVLNLPYGGGKGGVKCDPAELSDRELEQISRGFIRGLHKYLGENIDIPAPDVGSNGKIMSWMVDEYIKIKGEYANGVITGKPIEFGGSLGRNEATGLGVAIITREIAKRKGINIKGAKVAIQGFGNVGSFSAMNLEKMGAKIVAITKTDKKNGTFAVVNMDGMSYEALRDYRDKTGSFKGFEGAKEEIPEQDFWKLDVDILIPAALENALTTENANDIKAKIIVEGGNGPTTPDAEKILEDKGVTIVPDVVANSGGILVSYFEWVQNISSYYWSLEEVEKKQEIKMIETFDKIYALSKKHNVSLRKATYMYSVKRIAEAMRLRGWY